jgi:pimeloyl-ACP methyl ester carboxylesterase
MPDHDQHTVPIAIQTALASGNTEQILDAVANLDGPDAERLDALLGADTVRGLQRSARRRRAKPLGRVVVTHGITGSELAARDASGDRDKIWVNVFRLLRGRISELRMEPSGKSTTDVEIAGIRVEYLPLIVELSSRWDVLTFAYDWRENIDISAERLDRAVAHWAGGAPAHVVAHSMGGLVARRFIQRFGSRWQSMDDPSGRRTGGRLVMLGTPNHGSFAVTTLLSGDEKLIKWLEVLDAKHGMKELLEILDSFHGSYQMLPSPLLQFGDDRHRLASREAWGPLPVTQALLDLGYRFQHEIASIVDPERMIYVAGYDRKTPYRIRIDKVGQFSYQHTMDGDGRVPHELGLLHDVPTYWLNETHGDLPRNERLHTGIHDLLVDGKTDALESHRPRSRAITPADAGWLAGADLCTVSTEDREALQALAKGRRSVSAQVAEGDAAYLEAGLLEDFLGGTPEQRRSPARRMGDEQGGQGTQSSAARQRLRLEVHCGDITKVEANVYAVGHYLGVEPQNAELAVDYAVSGIDRNASTGDAGLVITQLTRRGVIKGELGEVYFYPFAGARAGKHLAAIAGMGSMGTFGRRQLVRLSESLASATGSLPDARSMCMVLIGSGVGGLRTAVAAEAILEGLLKAMGDSVRPTTIQTLKLVESSYSKALELHDELEALVKRISGSKGTVQIQLVKRVTRGEGAQLGTDYALALALSGISIASGAGGGEQHRKAIAAIVDSLGLSDSFRREVGEELAKVGSSAGSGRGRIELPQLARKLGLNLRRASTRGREASTRISASWDGTNAIVAALTDVAVVPERAHRVQRGLLEEAIRRMTDPPSEAVQDLGRRLNALLLPRDFRDILRESNGPVIFEVDRPMANVHWEMMAQDTTRPADAKPLGLCVQMARQLRTAYSTVPAPEITQGTRLRALVIGDPGDPNLGHALAGARRESIEVATFLDSCGVDVKLMIGAPGTPNERFKGGPVPSAALFDVLSELMDGGYDILHYAGHGDFDSEDPTARSGWLFKGGLLTASELERVDLAPRLVVANACLSGRTSNKRASDLTRGRQDADLLPGLADEFFRRGVRNYVGAAWEVDDLGAIEFAAAFYGALIRDRKTMGESMLHARQTLAKRSGRFAALWAAYQHYGSPGFTPYGASQASPARGKPAENINAPAKPRKRVSGKSATRKSRSRKKPVSLKTKAVAAGNRAK